MMIRVVATILYFSVLFLAGDSNLRAETRDIDRLSDAADAIVVGEVQSGQQTAYGMTFVLNIIRSLKGDLSPGATISVSWSSALQANRSLKGYYGLWFLKKSAGWVLSGVLHGQYPLEYAYFPLPRTAGPALLNIASPRVTDLIAAELMTAIQLSTDRSLLYHLESGFLEIGESTATPGLYGILHSNPDPELKYIGLAGLLRSGDSSALAEVASDPDAVSRVQAHGFVSAALSSWRGSDPVTIRNIGKIASSPDQALQSSAAQALEYIHTRDTLPFLAQLLDSQSAWIRDAAMRGLSRFVENFPVQTVNNTLNGVCLIPQGPAPYRTSQTDKYSLSTRLLGQENDAEYVQFWKSWWSTMKAQLAGSS